MLHIITEIVSVKVQINGGFFNTLNTGEDYGVFGYKNLPKIIWGRII